MTTVWRNRVNMVAGWLIGYGIFLFITYLDPLSVYTQSQTVDGSEADSSLVVVHVFFAALSVIGFALWAVPYVRTSPGEVHVVNPLSTWTLPAEVLGTLEEGFMFPRVRCRGRTIQLWGLERSVADSIRGHIVEPVAAPASADASIVEPSRRRTLRPALGVLMALWLAASIAGVLRAAG